jgi:uncharacterized protein (DUF2141 family)
MNNLLHLLAAPAVIGAAAALAVLWPQPLAANPGGGGAAGAAGEVELQLSGVRSARGQVVATLCSSRERFPDHCRSGQVTVVAKAGVVRARFTGLAPGRYAIAAFHDEDGDGRLALSSRGWPSEGFAFSNDAMARSGVPDFQAASFELRHAQRVSATLRYMR